SAMTGQIPEGGQYGALLGSILPEYPSTTFLANISKKFARFEKENTHFLHILMQKLCQILF
ncbi:hypothetical protein, partial [Pedobacter petrophilus]|uniref:hypothetical protein n=1 Tax=Pedobacter petrophilus TaxID=1908241 RepID=UPI001AE02117